jgi:hypothetical protein
VAQQLLNGADITAVLEEVRREGVAKRVAGGALGDPGGEDRTAHRLLHDRLVKMVPAALACLRLDIGPSGREDPLPRPLTPRRRELPRESIGQLDPATACREIHLPADPAAGQPIFPPTSN